MAAIGVKHEITRAEIMPMADYARLHQARRAEMLGKKRHRRLEIGPVATAHFENYDTMWHQVHEMLFIEKGGEDQVAGELEAYNPLIPKGRELVATVLFEIDDPERRRAWLSRLGGVEETMFLGLGGQAIPAVPEADLDRTTAAGKASAVQFVHFPFTDAQVETFRRPGCEIVLGFKHPAYAHQAVMPEPVRAALAADFD